MPTSTRSSACCVGAGFSLPDVAHAFGALDSHLYGFTMQVASWPFDVADYPQVAEEAAAALDPERYPNLVAMASMVATGDGGVPLDFTFGLDLLLDGLERRLHAHANSCPEPTADDRQAS